MKTQHFTSFNEADIVPLTRIKIVQYNNAIYFLIKYPILKFRCKKTIIFPIARGNQILHLQEPTIATCQNHTVTVKNCSNTTPAFCLTSSTKSCALQLMTHNTTNCGTTFNNLPPITMIGDGLIVINDQTAIIEENDEIPVTVNGTYLVNFEKQVKVNGTLFYNENSTAPLKPEVPLSPNINLTQHIEILSAPYLHHVKQQNLRHIKHLKENIERSSITNYVFIGAFVIMGLLAYAFQRAVVSRKKISIAKSVKAAIETTTTRAADAPHLEGEELS